MCSPVDREKHCEPEAQQDTDGNGKKGAPQNEVLLPTLRPQHTQHPCDSHIGNAKTKCDLQPYML